MYYVIEGDNLVHRANIEYRAFLRGLTGDSQGNRLVLTSPDPYVILGIIAEAGGRIVDHGDWYLA